MAKPTLECPENVRVLLGTVTDRKVSDQTGYHISRIHKWRVALGIAPRRKWSNRKKFKPRYSLWSTPADFAQQAEILGTGDLPETCRLLAKHYGKQYTVIMTKLRELALCPTTVSIGLEDAYPEIRTRAQDHTGVELALHYGVSRQMISLVLTKLNPTIPKRRTFSEVRTAQYTAIIESNPEATTQELQALGVPATRCPKPPVQPRREELVLRDTRIVELLQQTPQPSDRSIGELLCVCLSYVGKIRHKLGMPPKFTKMGRGNGVSQKTMNQIRDMLTAGISGKTIAETLGVSTAYVSKFKTGHKG